MSESKKKKPEPKIKRSKVTTPQPRPGLIALGRRIPLAELYARPQTGIGIEPLSPWSECQIFPGTFEQLCAHYRRLQEEQETAEREQREKAHAAARAREPKLCSSILDHAERRAIKSDPDLIAKCEHEPPITEACSDAWLSHEPEEVLQRADRVKQLDSTARRALKIETERPATVLQLGVLINGPVRLAKRDESSQTVLLEAEREAPAVTVDRAPDSPHLRLERAIQRAP